LGQRIGQRRRGRQGQRDDGKDAAHVNPRVRFG
jgi:hypothetical protein